MTSNSYANVLKWKGDQKLFMKFCMLEMWREYWRGSGSGRKEMWLSRNREFTYLGDSVSADKGCEAAVTARTRWVWVKFRECGKLLHGNKFPLKLRGRVYKSNAIPAILHRSEGRHLKENMMGVLRKTRRFIVRAMRGVQLDDGKKLRTWRFSMKQWISWLWWTVFLGKEKSWERNIVMSLKRH